MNLWDILFQAPTRADRLVFQKSRALFLFRQGRKSQALKRRPIIVLDFGIVGARAHAILVWWHLVLLQGPQRRTFSVEKEHFQPSIHSFIFSEVSPMSTSLVEISATVASTFRLLVTIVCVACPRSGRSNQHSQPPLQVDLPDSHRYLVRGHVV